MLNHPIPINAQLAWLYIILAALWIWLGFQPSLSNHCHCFKTIFFHHFLLNISLSRLRGPPGQDQPGFDLDKYLIALHSIHSRRGIKWHNANKLNNRNGIRNIQSKDFLKCKLPWSCPEQMTGEDMTTPTTPTYFYTPKHTHQHRRRAPLQPWLQLSPCSIGKIQENRETNCTNIGQGDLSQLKCNCNLNVCV